MLRLSGAIPLLPTYAFAAEAGTTYIKYHCEALSVRNSSAANTKHQIQKTTPRKMNHIFKKVTKRFNLETEMFVSKCKLHRTVNTVKITRLGETIRKKELLIRFEDADYAYDDNNNNNNLLTHSMEQSPS
jgi:hypothetical protein